ncbi:hypothetical protein EZV62_016221 [Acer yangbiense]|uniref:VPS37 C-terminal domain-containing protein n=1 Tax=Acer yangbiense TaxID=1000413 RepID=A0A5C7HQ94_9ROSI|nr:hypothetical protein EZV62_016221 [Acer yangbiense]
MGKIFLLFPFLLSCSFLHGYFALDAGTNDGSEQWGYVEVRPKAHLFWWLYKSPNRVDDPSKPWPILLWLQGGPGASGVGLGNFLEIGPLDGHLKPRNYTWLKKADLLFVDSPVGTGFSYVEDESLVVKTDEDAATDLTTLLKMIFNGNENLQKSPLYIFAESYGGKFAVTLGLSALKAIQAGQLKLQLGGVALGNSWISPEDIVFSWAPLLKDLSRMNNNGLNISNSLALNIKQQIAEGKYENATSTWEELENVIAEYSNNVDFYNFLFDDGNSPISATKQFKGLARIDRYSRYLSTKKSSKADAGGSDVDLDSLMNGPIKKKLQIIPENVTWGGQGDLVFSAMTGDFMKPRIKEVDELLAKGVNVTVYNGQVDLICCTKGVEAWVQKLKSSQEQQAQPRPQDAASQSWYPQSVVSPNSSRPSTPGSSSSSSYSLQRPTEHPQTPSHVSPGEAAGVIALLKDKSVDELRKLLSDKDAYHQFLLSVDQVKIQNNIRDELRKETLQLAEQNLEKEPRIMELRNQCKIIRTTELAAAQEKLNELNRQKEELLKFYSPGSLLQKLQEAMNKTEEESEALHRQLLDKEIDIVSFVQKYKKLRTIYHQRALIHLAAKTSSIG